MIKQLSMRNTAAAIRHNRGFTIIEILVVLIILLILASLATLGLDIIEKQRGQLLTNQRMENVLNSLARLGMAGTGSVTFELQDKLPNGLAGTRRFERGMGIGAKPYVLPEDRSGDGEPDPWHKVFPHPDAVGPENPVVGGADPGNPLVMAYPWGHERRYRIGTWPSGGDGDDYYWDLYESQVHDDPDYAYPAPERHIIHELWPQASGDILTLLNIASDAETYHHNRNPKQGWNDAWGNPLVVAYALYQPPAYQGNDPSRYPDSYLQLAHEAYGYNRSIYVSVGAPGPDISPYKLTENPAINMIAMWNHITDVTMPSDDLIWDERSFDSNPWGGIHRNSMGSRTAFISAPVEFR